MVDILLAALVRGCAAQVRVDYTLDIAKASGIIQAKFVRARGVSCAGPWRAGLQFDWRLEADLTQRLI